MQPHGTSDRVLTLTGDLDGSSVVRLRRQLQDHLREVAEPGSWLTLDLAGVGFVGGQALGVLVEARAAGGLFRLRAAPRALRRLITSAGLAAVFPEAAEPPESAGIPVARTVVDGYPYHSGHALGAQAETGVGLTV